MKFAIALCLMMFAVAAVVSKPQYNGVCNLYTLQCVSCSVGTHPFNSRCKGFNLSAPTCSSPKAYDLGGVCDVIRCDCDSPTLLDETTGKCVEPEDCPPPPLA